MTVVALDTHAVVKELVAAGFTDEQAEAVTRIVRQAQDVDLSTLATRSDLFGTKADLEKNIAAVKADLEKSIVSVKADLEKSVVSVKADLEKSIAAIKAELEKSIAAIKSDLEKSLAETRVDILKWMIGSIGIQTVVIIGAVLALTRSVPH
jgi:hypothetical protein